MCSYNLAIEALANDCSEHGGCSLPLCIVNLQQFNHFVLSWCVIGLNPRCGQGHCWCNAILRQQKETAQLNNKNLVLKDAVLAHHSDRKMHQQVHTHTHTSTLF